MDSARLYDAPETAYSGLAWRHVGPAYDPRSGEGARLAGGRFNPPNSFPVLYLCLTRPCVAAELRRLAERQVVGLAGLLPRRLVCFDVDLASVVDLTDRTVRDHIKIELGDLVDEDQTVCRAIGVALHARSVQGLITPSTAGVDVVLAVFPENLGAGRLELVGDDLWNDAEDLDSPR